MKYFNLVFFVAILSFNLSAAHHEEQQQVGITGLISSEVFDLAGEMNLYVEKYQSCGDADNQKHYHPVGTLVICLMERLLPYHPVNGKNIQKDLIGLNLLCGCMMAMILINQNLVMINADRHW